MSFRPPVSDEILTADQRRVLFYGSNVDRDDALHVPAEDLTLQFLRRQKVGVANMSAAGVGPRALRRMGADGPQALRNLGFDALHLSKAAFASEAKGAFGAEPVVSAFLCNASDAVCLAGSEAKDILRISSQQLLEACAGAPIEAKAVLQQTPLTEGLVGVSPQTILDCGVRKATLMELGYSLALVVSHTNAGPESLAKMGFGI